MVVHNVANLAYSNMKKMLRRFEIVRMLYKSIKGRQTISPLLDMIEQNRMVVLKPYFQMKGNETDRMIVHETVKDYLDHFGILAVKKTRAEQLSLPKNTVLLHQALALLKLPLSHERYLNTVGAKTRNTIRKAERQAYEFRKFDWNNHLDEIFDINTSKEIRSAGPMHGWYTEPVKPRYHSEEEQRYRKYYGVFKDERLCAYLNLVLCGDFAFFKHCIGHADHLKHGIMNYLLSCTVQEYANHPHIEWLNYEWMSLDRSNSETAFKKHAGFKAYATFLDLEHDQELLKYSRGMWRGDL